MKVKKEKLVTVEDESTTIQELHEEWARDNGYRNNDRLNSQNTIGFKDGAKR